jgi:EAL domain-containing protein (putative c-di-GMP-specific phosphodiesterase class I)
MRHGDWLLAIGLAALAAGVGVLTYLQIGIEFRVEWVLAAALMLLCALQIAGIVSRRISFSKFRKQLAALDAAQRQGMDRSGRLVERIDELESRPAQAARSDTQSLVEEVKALRATLKGLAEKQSARSHSEMHTHPAAAPAERVHAHPEQRVERSGRVYSPEQLDLYLEPIIDAAANSTAHYRASLSLRSGEGRRIAPADLQAEADSDGSRPMLDQFAYERCAAVAPKIVSRRPSALIFVPLGAATYQDSRELRTLEALHDASRGVANSIVFELSDRDLSGLDSVGVAGLAQLARRGCTLALAFSRPMSVDLPALRELNVRFMICPVRLVPTLSQVLVAAGKSGFRLIVSEVEQPADVDLAQRTAVYASGPHFAPPRLVKGDLAGAARARAA